jgi:hypothetical protein
MQNAVCPCRRHIGLKVGIKISLGFDACDLEFAFTFVLTSGLLLPATGFSYWRLKFS